MAVEVRNPVGEHEHVQAWDVLQRSFNWPDTQRDRWLAGIVPDRMVVAVVDGEVAATAQTHDFRQAWGGRWVPMGGVFAVGVDPAQRGRGLAARVMERTLAQSRDRGECLSGLYPATTHLYRSAGYELAGVWTTRTAPATAFRLGGTVRARRATADDDVAVRSLYDAVAVGTNGFLDRNDDRWRRVLDAERHRYVVDGPDGVDGHLAYRHLPARGSWGFSIRVEELTARTPEAVRALWSVVGGAASQAPEVSVVGPPEHPALLVLDEQLALEPGDEIRWMLRIVDAPAAVAARGFARGLSLSTGVTLDDPLFGANAGPWRLSVEGGRGTLEPGGEGGVRLGPRGLAALYAGYATTSALVAAGLCDRPDEVLDAAFAGPTAWMPDFF